MAKMTKEQLKAIQDMDVATAPDEQIADAIRMLRKDKKETETFTRFDFLHLLGALVVMAPLVMGVGLLMAAFMVVGGMGVMMGTRIVEKKIHPEPDSWEKDGILKGLVKEKDMRNEINKRIGLTLQDGRQNGFAASLAKKLGLTGAFNAVAPAKANSDSAPRPVVDPPGLRR